MAEYLSDAWIEDLGAAVAADEGLRRAARGVRATVQQVVVGGPGGDVAWHVVIDDGTVAVRPGAADHPDVTFEEDYDAARRVTAGELSPQAAFMTGRLRVRGDLPLLVRHQPAFAALALAAGAVRARTTFAASP
ncbi:MAG TPA: SCP2 sterol-binding domain-containing protein [Acidimicrobiales bacterium]